MDYSTALRRVAVKTWLARSSGSVPRAASSGCIHSILPPVSPDGRLLETSPGVFIGTTQVDAGPGGGIVFRLTVPVVDIDVNGETGPITFAPGDLFHLTIAYHTNDAGTVNPARIYIGVSTPFGVCMALTWRIHDDAGGGVFGACARNPDGDADQYSECRRAPGRNGMRGLC